MWWECGECGDQHMRERAPAVCGECGRAGAFVAVVPELEADSDASSPRAAWLRAGGERHLP
jgi:hypothetical protein